MVHNRYDGGGFDGRYRADGHYRADGLGHSNRLFDDLGFLPRAEFHGDELTPVHYRACLGRADRLSDKNRKSTQMQTGLTVGGSSLDPKNSMHTS
ncbi:MAG: hypothetical protein GY880_26895 [Planctomycetaceae bacterium]|nr:hypothetical protein [Planctomycetaceae bacterium]MCP4777863.1 hypothetical protein [Planctomycetaceae bacterium]